AAHPSTQVLCLGYAIDDGEVKLWLPSQPVPFDLTRTYDRYLAHNAQFDFNVWNKVSGLPPVPIEKWYDVMAACAASAFPLSLGKAGEAAGIPEQKLKVGKSLILMLCRPDKTGKWPDKVKYRERYEAMYHYCKTDVVAMRALVKVLPETAALDPESLERKVWLNTARLNQRGAHVDVPFARGMVRLLGEAAAEKNRELSSMTKGAVSGGTAVTQIMGALQDKLPNLCAETVSQALQEPLRTDFDRALLQGRQYIAKSSTAKYRRMLDYADEQGRVHDLLAYHAAATGRYGGRGIQIQNFPRSSPPDPEPFMSLVSSGRPSVSTLEAEYGPIPEVASRYLRSTINAPATRNMCVADYSSVEAVAADWSLGDEAGLEGFRRGLDCYKVTASGMYGVGYDEVDEKQRQAGKIAVLACTYNGGWKALKEFARGYGVDWTPKEAMAIVRAYRRAKPGLPLAWKEFGEMSVTAVRSGVPVVVNSVRSCRFGMLGQHLWMKLPGGRKLWFPFARTEMISFDYEDEDGQVKKITVEAVTHMKMNAQAQWVRRGISGGSLFESYIQGLCRDLLVEAEIRLAEAGELQVLSVHDEIGIEVDTEGGMTHTELERIMSVLPSWAEGFPLRAKGWAGPRFKK
ncbi:MAG: hypothetical protein BWK76_28110, partial [Desulfobulbaceae bacterium A2]